MSVAFKPAAAEFAMWDKLNEVLIHIRDAEFHLGLHPEMPQVFGLETVATHLMDARIALGAIANALADEVAGRAR